MNWSTWAIPLTIGVAWACFRMWRAAGPPVAQIANDDPAMIEAIAKARTTIPDFVRALQTPAAGSRDFSIKAHFPDLQEHMWVTVLQYADGVFTGALGNAPRSSTTLKLGDEVRVPEDLISDWKYIENDILAGGYSLRLIRSRMTDKARKDFDSRLDFTFAVFVLALVGVFAGSRLASAQTNGPEQAARDFLYALYGNDATDFQRRIVPEPNSELMVGRQTVHFRAVGEVKKRYWWPAAAPCVACVGRWRQGHLLHAVSWRRDGDTDAALRERMARGRAVLAGDDETGHRPPAEERS